MTLSVVLAVVFAIICLIFGLLTYCQNIKISIENTRLSTDNARLSERILHFETEEPQRRADSEARFKVIAAEILDASAARQRQSHDEHLSSIIAPLKADIEEFSRNVTKCYDSEARERFSLKERIRELIELNNTIGREAKELTVALKGSNKVQGAWGEMVLETILQKSGLRRGYEYIVQETTTADGTPLKDDKGVALRPDVVVYYPDGRCIVIDSKVSLTGYLNYVKATTVEEEKIAARQHLSSVRSHIAELRNKRYQDFTGSDKTDFVIMFIPNEPAYLAAMQIDSNLWQEAYDSRVLLVSPTHLISVLRLIDQLWRQDRQTKNAIDIATAAGRMYDKLVGFVDDLAKVDKAISAAHDACQQASSKLSNGKGNLISRAQKLREMGAKTSRNLPEADSES